MENQIVPYQYFRLLIVAVKVLCLFLPHPLDAVCKDTDCQKNSWAVVGCEQYGMKEVRKRECDNGFIYSCCNSKSKREAYPGSSELEDPGEGSQYSTEPSESSAESGRSSTEPIVDRYGDMTYFHLGLTACGDRYSDEGMVGSVASGHFTTRNPNTDPICGRHVKILDPYNDREIIVKVVDKCPACKMDDINVSPAAFKMLQSLDVGGCHVRWHFIT